MNLKEQLYSKLSLTSDSTPVEQTPSYPITPRATNTHIGLAFTCALGGLFIFPEIFDSVAIILGAYAWKRQQGNVGLYIVILGIACMLIGLYFTAFALIDLFP